LTTTTKITAELKDEILEKVKLGESVSSLSRHYDISDKTIYRWLKEGVHTDVSLYEYTRMRRENQQLKEIVGVLTFEFEKLKKKTNH
jgi:transposase-like protein